MCVHLVSASGLLCLSVTTFLVFVILHGVSGVAFEFLSQDVYIAVEIL